MARNTSPANAAPRRTEPREGQAASRPGQQQPYPQQGFQPALGYPYPHHEAVDGYESHAGNRYVPLQPPPYGHPAEPNVEPGRRAPAGPGYPPLQSTQSTHYAPQFEPYQSPPAHPPPPQQWQQHTDPAEAYQQAPPLVASQRVEPAHYDPAAYGHGDAPYAGEAYQPPHAAQQLRGPAYDQTPPYVQVQGEWSQPPAAEGQVPYPSYPHQEPTWDAPQGYGDPYAYQDQHGYEQPGYDPIAYGQQAYAEAGYPSGPPPQVYSEPTVAYPDHASDPNAYPPEPGFGSAEGAYAPPQHQAADGYGEGEYDPDELAYEDDQPSGRLGWVKMAAIAAVGVAIVGGGVYGYTTFVKPSQSGDPPLVRKAEAPSRIKPDDPGGKKFAHTDSKILGRLSDSSATPAGDGAADSENGGTRKVSTMVIGRDGSIVASTDTDRPPPSRLPQAVSPVPGMTIVDGFGGRAPQVSAQPAPSAPAMVNAPAANGGAPAPVASAPRQAEAPPPAKPVVIARTEPAPASVEVAAPPAANAAAKPAPTRKVTRTAAVPQPSASASSGAGYVAVLASIPRSGSSRMDALKQFADLQQKYGAQLGGKTPDVQEANLGDKGTYHRLVVGPPGSRQEASRLCSQLKSAGYTSCWIKSY